jgi:DNA-directed RNA polymerase specialized sigma24 family protein
LVRRAQIVQHAVDGLSPPEIAARLADRVKSVPQRILSQRKMR